MWNSSIINNYKEASFSQSLYKINILNNNQHIYKNKWVILNCIYEFLLFYKILYTLVKK
jgi:hypothetical protein